MTIHKTAERLKVHERVLSKKLKSGEIAGQKINGHWGISDQGVSRLLSERYELNPDYMDVEEIAGIIRKHPETVREFIRDGELPARKDILSHGEKWFVKRSDFEPMQRILSEPPKRTGRPKKY